MTTDDPLVRVTADDPEPSLRLVELPGLDAVGHGIYLRPHQPHQLRRVLFERRAYRRVGFRDADRLFQVPQGYEVDDSPPMPADQLLNQVLIEDSWDRFDKQMSLDTRLSAGTAAFSFNASAGQAKQMRVSEEAHYAIRSSCIPLWSVYLADDANLIADLQHAAIPVPFRHEHRAEYDRFFEQFGSHYVKRAWVGGAAQLFLTVLKSSGLTKEEINAGLKAGTGALVGGETSSRTSHSRERLQASSQCCVAGKGGDELKLAALSSLDEARYNEWLATIRHNPQIIELEVAGLWTLLRDSDRAQALREAYLAATSFEAISAAFAVDKVVYFIRGRRYFTYAIESQRSEKPRLLAEQWPALAAIGFDRIDAAFSGRDLVTPAGERLGRKIYFFRKDLVARLDVDTGNLDADYPRPIREAFPGLEFERIDAALENGRDQIFFFSGKKYARFSLVQGRVEDGYPDLVHRRWHGVTFERIDAAIYWGNAKVYFFKDDQHVRFDMVTRRADPGYPKSIVGNYVEDWRFFD